MIECYRKCDIRQKNRLSRKKWFKRSTWWIFCHMKRSEEIKVPILRGRRQVDTAAVSLLQLVILGRWMFSSRFCLPYLLTYPEYLLHTTAQMPCTLNCSLGANRLAPYFLLTLPAGESFYEKGFCKQVQSSEMRLQLQGKDLPADRRASLSNPWSLPASYSVDTFFLKFQIFQDSMRQNDNFGKITTLHVASFDE